MVRMGTMRAVRRYIVKCVKRSLGIQSPSAAFGITDRDREEAMDAPNRAIAKHKEGDDNA